MTLTTRQAVSVTDTEAAMSQRHGTHLRGSGAPPCDLTQDC